MSSSRLCLPRSNMHVLVLQIGVSVAFIYLGQAIMMTSRAPPPKENNAFLRLSVEYIANLVYLRPSPPTVDEGRGGTTNLGKRML